jgi:16S rRNA A1518/A1519 N6-dimethyltransferase RsmA/KsgA/DIM1 with predicted DNA glycosylase/AP lyase activity
VARKIARAIRVSKHSLAPASAKSNGKEHCWIEIGAGHGEMTAHLAATGVPVYAIELDTVLARKLKRSRQAIPKPLGHFR